MSPAQSFTIAGRQYTVVSRLGEGGYAVVELVQAANDGRRFALKRIQLGSHDARMVRPQFVVSTATWLLLLLSGHWSPLWEPFPADCLSSVLMNPPISLAC